jgi:hypothetical protein
MIQVGQLPRHDVPLLDEALTLTRQLADLYHAQPLQIGFRTNKAAHELACRVGQNLLDEALTPIASAHPPLASPLRLVLDRQRRPLHWLQNAGCGCWRAGAPPAG